MIAPTTPVTILHPSTLNKRMREKNRNVITWRWWGLFGLQHIAQRFRMDTFALCRRKCWLLHMKRSVALLVAYPIALDTMGGDVVRPQGLFGYPIRSLVRF